MTGRRARLLGCLLCATVLAMAANARAELSLFGSYWDNIARAAASNDVGQVRQLVGGGNNPNNDIDDKGRTGLHIAAINGNLQIAAILIKAKMHLDLKDPLGNTPLSLAAERSHAEMVKLLLDVGAAVDPENRNGMTPLMMAARNGNIEIVQALLAKGASTKKTDFTGRDALSWAADSRKAGVVQALQRAAARR